MVVHGHAGSELRRCLTLVPAPPLPGPHLHPSRKRVSYSAINTHNAADWGLPSCLHGRFRSRTGRSLFLPAMLACNDI